MELSPAPRFMHVLGVERIENKIKGIIVMQDICPMAKVVSNNSEKLAHIKPGMIVFFRMDNFNPLFDDDKGINGVLFEDAVMAYCEESAIYGGVRYKHASVIDPTNPGPGILTPQGLRMPRPN